MSYSNLKDYNDPIKPYILDALEKRRLLELEMRKSIHTAFEGFLSPIVSYIAFQKGEFKGMDATLEKLIEKALLLEDFSRVNPFFIKKLNSCQKPLIADIHYKGVSYYDVKENKIYYNAFINDPRSIKAGFKTNMTGFLHEAGHYLDYNLSKDGKPLHTKMKNLDHFLKIDALHFINNIYRNKLGKQAVDFKNLSPQELKNGLDFYKKLGEKTGMKGLDKLVISELNKDFLNSSFVSDLLDGVTRGNLFPPKIDLYKHDLHYWTEDTIRAESTAHFFEAIGSGGDRLRAFKSTFIFTYFLKISIKQWGDEKVWTC